jgi:hypothetical protein
MHYILRKKLVTDLQTKSGKVESILKQAYTYWSNNLFEMFNSSLAFILIYWT